MIKHGTRDNFGSYSFCWSWVVPCFERTVSVRKIATFKRQRDNDDAQRWWWKREFNETVENAIRPPIGAPGAPELVIGSSQGKIALYFFRTGCPRPRWTSTRVLMFRDQKVLQRGTQPFALVQWKWDYVCGKADTLGKVEKVFAQSHGHQGFKLVLKSSDWEVLLTSASGYLWSLCGTNAEVVMHLLCYV